MRDPMSWSLPLGRLFGIVIRVHLLFPMVAVGLILRAAFHKDALPGDWIIASGLMALLFLSVLLHEFGHCFGARFMDGDAHDIMLWPLGGLAYVDVPHTARANFVTVAAGPLVNLLLCVASGLVLWYAVGAQPPWPWWPPYSKTLTGAAGEIIDNPLPWQLWLARFYFLNMVLFLFNLLPGFPMDGGRMLQCAMWPRLGYRQATVVAIYVGFVVAICMFVIAIMSSAYDGVLFLTLALFIYYTCQKQYIILEHGGEDSVFGYDFSQGYTSLERDQPPPRKRRRPGIWQRWLQRRAARKMQRDVEQREAEERRMDELLEKVQREGLQALSEEERRFLTRVSAKYRNR
ncbi:MAG TPA: site-2 protease family protein [Gemmataceae bacterium]|jgi:Zn-dependent protease|nr:site-2 protease family protein [Gemmataceae bacterium]